jgi:hypothetical protein
MEKNTGNFCPDNEDFWKALIHLEIAWLGESPRTFGKSGDFWKVSFTVSKSVYHCLLMTLFLREITYISRLSVTPEKNNYVRRSI